MRTLIATFFLLVTFPNVILVDDDKNIDLCNVYGNTTYDNYTSVKTDSCGCTDQRNCVKKCCQFGYYHYHLEDPRYGKYESICIKNPKASEFSLLTYENTTKKGIFTKFTIGMPICNSQQIWRYFKMNNSDPDEKYYIQEDGRLYYPYYNKFYSNDRFCVDEEDRLSVYLCYTPEDSGVVALREVNNKGMMISMPFLLITFLVYAILPDSNLHRKALMFYVLMLLVGDAFLVTAQLSGPMDNSLCQFVGYAIVFCFMASFFWMNVMCFDMWLAFSGTGGYGRTKDEERKKFIYYSIYAWGLPVLQTIGISLVNQFADKNALFNPKLGVHRCFLEDGFPMFFYFYLPMAIIITINIVFFVLTTVKIHKVKKETKMLKYTGSQRHSFNKEDKQKYKLYLKLMFAMGINWSLEIISWAVILKEKSVPTWVWYLTDLTNAAYGVIIFFLFVFKKKVWMDIKKRYYVLTGEQNLANSSSSKKELASSTSSTAETAVSDDFRLRDIQLKAEKK